MAQKETLKPFKRPAELPPCASHRREVWAWVAAKALSARHRRPDSYKSAPCFLLLLLILRRPSGQRFRSSSSARDPRNRPRPLRLFAEHERFGELRVGKTSQIAILQEVVRCFWKLNQIN